MGARRLLGYGDAVVLLGGDPPGLAALDEALGGALNLATGGVSETVLNLVGAQDNALRLGRGILGRLRESVDSSPRATRTQRIEAAHTVLVVTAYFETLEETELPFRWEDVRLTRAEQLRLAGGDAGAGGFVATLLSAPVPVPAPHQPHEVLTAVLGDWFAALARRLLDFVMGLALGDALDAATRGRAEAALSAAVPLAVQRYQELYARLAAEIPEFGLWSDQIEHQATRAEVRTALSGVRTLLAGLAAAAEPVDVAAALTTAYEAALHRPILAEGEVPTGVSMPSLREGYLDPRFRVREVGGGSGGPAEEDWWSGLDVRDDLTEYLAGALTGAGLTAAPLVVLGQPGAGKSVLTRVLASGLASTGFLPVRVVLREVPADAEIQDQIEYAIRSATGERATWPQLVRSAPGLTPVVMFDGFDELLQATGVSQSDFLLRVAAFQQREADQGRPVVALVTTRTAVADRARYPEGAVALRLEPFSERQVENWLAVWRRTNEAYFAARGMAPLPAAAAMRHGELASQPLLLLMLALYDAADNALQRGDAPLDEAQLYEDLLTAFAAREVGKSAGAPRPGETAALVEQELQRLSLVAFGMLNRRRQWVTADELERDLTALLSRTPVAATGFRAPLNRAEVALGRFFFVQRAQAVRDQQQLATYEFLHATFGEYLAVRLAVQLLHGLLAQRPVLLVGETRVDDDLLNALLSYVPLSSRQMLRFVDALVQRLPDADRDRLPDLIVQVLAAHELRTEHRHADYCPDRRATSARHGMYAANLVLFMLAATQGFTASRLFDGSDDPAGAWHRHALLWRSSFSEEEWTEFALSLTLRHTWNGPRRELEIRPVGTPPQQPEAVDVDWLYGRAPEPGAGHGTEWARDYWLDLPQRMTVSGGTSDSVVLHTLEPVLGLVGPLLMQFGNAGEGRSTSVAHDLLALLAASVSGSDEELISAYMRCGERGWWVIWVESMMLLLRTLAADAERLPVRLVADLLRQVLGALRLEAADLVLEAALAAYAKRPSFSWEDAEEETGTWPAYDTFELLRTAIYRSMEILAIDGTPEQRLRALVKVYHQAPVLVADFDDPLALLRELPFDTLPLDLRRQVRDLLATHYPEVTLRRPDDSG